MVNNREDFLMNLLNCGVLDLRLIDGVGYDWCDILNKEMIYGIAGISGNGSCAINFVMAEVVAFGIDQIETAISDRICELEAIPNERELDEDEEAELSVLRTLNPDEDISGFYNCIDTHVWMERNGSLYKRYLSEAIGDFEEGTGLEIECYE